MIAALLLALVLVGTPAFAQEPIPDDSYRDPGARELVRSARERRAVVDARITSYDVRAHERMSARLGVAGIDRLIFRRETVAQIAWTRDTVHIELLGAREAQPLVHAGAQIPPAMIAGGLPSLAFDPVDSEMLLRIDSAVIRHPLAPGSEAYYRFSSGDSTAIRLPDGRTVRLRELRIAARRADIRLINGSFWLDAETHAVVRVGFRMSRGFSSASDGVSVLRPEVSGELDHVAIDYGLWDFRWWLPRSVVARGVVRVAGMRLPLAYERSYDGYRVQGDTLASDPWSEEAIATAAERPCRPRAFGGITVNAGRSRDPEARDSAWDAAWDENAARVAAGGGRREGGPTASEDRDRPDCERAFIVTRAEDVDLIRSPVFEGSVYDQEHGPISEAELQELASLIEGIPGTPWGVGRPGFQLLTAGLIRYNRVEGLSLGGRAVLPLGPAELQAELRAGTTGELGGRLGGVHHSPARRLELAAYRGLEAVEMSSHPFSLASSASALLLGRDENDYFRGTGAELRLGPAAARAQLWHLRLFAERQEPVRARSEISLRGAFDDDFQIRPNLIAEAIDQAGLTLRVRGARGDDPTRLRTRAELELHGETGERSFARPLLRLQADRQFSQRLGFGVALAAGTGLGDVPIQREWQIGGAGTVRGHDSGALRGESLWLSRGELTWGSPVLRMALFGDAGWVGERSDFGSSRPLRGAGVGVSLLDNLLRLDVARGIGGGGYRVHLRTGGSL